MVAFLTMNVSSQEMEETENQNTEVILSRKKRFAVLGYLTLMLILLNTALLIVSNVVINNNNNNNNNNNGGGEKRSLENAIIVNDIIEKFPHKSLILSSRPRRSALAK